MDKFTKGILTVIAVGIIGLNVQMMNGGGFITKANASLLGEEPIKVTICSPKGMTCAAVSSGYRLYTSGM
jgi:hypothetical protein